MAFDMAGDVVLYSWARCFTLSKCLSLQVCRYGYVGMGMGYGLVSHPGRGGGDRNTLSRFMLRRKQK